jgi:hypothetical protein
MLIIEIPIKSELSTKGGIRQVFGTQLNMAEALQSKFAHLATNVRKIKGRRQHLLPIPEPGLAGQKFKILGARVHIHMDRKT